MSSKRLNERAAPVAGDIAPLWHVGKGQALFAGPLGHNARHQHSTPVFLAGLYGTFRLRIIDSEWLTCRTAVIPAGVAYEFDMGGDPLGVFYLEPSIAGVEALAPLVHEASEVRGALVGRTGEISLVRALYEDRSAAEWVGAALTDLAAYSKGRAVKEIDPRVSRIVEAMHERYGDLRPVAEVARSVGLSASRFQHLFSQAVGVPFRRYRAWHRLRAAIRATVKGANLTTAAHAAGFSDQAHFSRDFRSTFGAPASGSLSKLRG